MLCDLYDPTNYDGLSDFRIAYHFFYVVFESGLLSCDVFLSLGATGALFLMVCLSFVRHSLLIVSL